MVCVSGASAANQTRLRCNELEMGFVAVTTRFADRELTFLDFCGSHIGFTLCRSRQITIDG
jgi:hypothetical protein